MIRNNFENAIKTAYLNISDLSGNLVEKINIYDRGITFIEIIGDKYTRGMYSYALYFEDNVIDTKKMIYME